jgi:hypothetical protein
MAITALPDQFKGRPSDNDDPAANGEAISKSDTDFLTWPTRAIWVGGAGAMKVGMVGGQTVTIAGIPAGTLLPIQAVRVYSTDTDATLMVALW